MAEYCLVILIGNVGIFVSLITARNEVGARLLSQDLLGLCCFIETRDHIEIILITAVLFE